MVCDSEIICGVILSNGNMRRKKNSLGVRYSCENLWKWEISILFFNEHFCRIIAVEFSVHGCIMFFGCLYVQMKIVSLENIWSLELELIMWNYLCNKRLFIKKFLIFFLLLQKKANLYKYMIVLYIYLYYMHGYGIMDIICVLFNCYWGCLCFMQSLQIQLT